MSINTGGAGGNKRVVIEFIGNDTQLTTVLTRVNRNLKAAMDGAKISVAGVGTAVNTTSTSMAGLGTAVETTATKTNTLTGALGNINSTSKTTTSGLDAMANATKNVQGGLDSTNTLAGKSSDSIGKLGDAGEKTGGKMSKLKEAFSGNRGLIYSMGTIFGTMTGVVAEMDLLKDANGQVAEATEKLNKLQEEGKQGTQEYSQAQQQLEKANRFLGFTTRNLSLAMANFVPEILLLATNLSRSEGLVGKLTGALGKLKGGLGISSLLNAIGGAGSTAGAGLNAAATGAVTLTGALKGLLVVAGPVTAIIAGLAIGPKLAENIPDVEKFRKSIGDLFDSIVRAVPGAEPLMESFDKWAKENLPFFYTQTEKAKDGVNDLGNATAKAAPQSKLLSDAQNDLANKTQIYNDAVKSGMATHKMYNDVVDAQTKVNQIVAGTYSELTGGIDDNRNALLKNSGVWIDFGTNVKASIGPTTTLEEQLYKASHTSGLLTDATETLEQQLAKARVTTGGAANATVIYHKAISDTIGPTTDLQKASALSAQNMDQFLEQLNVGIPAQKNFHAQLVLMAQDYPQITNAASLTTEQLKLQILAANHDEDAMATLADETEDAAKGNDKLSAAAEKAAEKQEKFKKAIEDANKELEDNAINLAGALKIKDIDSDKFLKKLLKAFPKEMKADIKTKVNLITKKQELEKDFRDIISVAIEANEKGEFKFDPNIVADDKAADQFAKGLITDITKTFGSTPPTKFKVLQEKIQAAIADPNTGEALIKIFTEAGFLSKIEGAGTTAGENITKGITTAFEGFSGGGLDFGENGEGGLFGPIVDQSKSAADIISKQKYEFAAPQLNDFQTAGQKVLKATQSLFDAISKTQYNLAPPNLKPFDNTLRTAYSHAKSVTQSNIAKIKYNFPPPDLKKFDDVLRDAYKHAKQVVANINLLQGTIHVKYVVDNKPPAGTKSSDRVISSSGNNDAVMGNNNGTLNVTLINTDEFSQAKLKKFKASLGKQSYRFM